MSRSKTPPEPRFQSGVIRAWRAWKVAKGDLCSLTAPQSWPHFQRLEATHLPHPGSNEHIGEAPCVGNLHCGIYAYKTPSHLSAMGPNATDAWGEVKLWGRLVEHEYAYRAQFAYPSLVICRSELAAKLIARNYGCEVVVDATGPAPTEQVVPVQQLVPSVTTNMTNLPNLGTPGTNPMLNLYVRTPMGMQYNYSGRADPSAIARWLEGLLPILYADALNQPGMQWQVMWGMNAFLV